MTLCICYVWKSRERKMVKLSAQLRRTERTVQPTRTERVIQRRQVQLQSQQEDRARRLEVAREDLSEASFEDYEKKYQQLDSDLKQYFVSPTEMKQSSEYKTYVQQKVEYENKLAEYEKSQQEVREWELAEKFVSRGIRTQDVEPSIRAKMKKIHAQENYQLQKQFDELKTQELSGDIQNLKVVVEGGRPSFTYEKFQTAVETKRIEPVMVSAKKPIEVDKNILNRIGIFTKKTPKEKLGQASTFFKRVFTGYKEAIGAGSDVLSAVLLRPVALQPSKQVAVSGEELRERSIKARKELTTFKKTDIIKFAMDIGKFIKEPFPIATIKPKELARLKKEPVELGFEKITGTFPQLPQVKRTQKISLEQLRTISGEEQIAKVLGKEKQREFKFLESRVERLEKITEKEKGIAKEIEGKKFKPEEVEEITKRQEVLQKEREGIIQEIESSGIRVREKEGRIKFESRALTADIGLADIKQLAVTPTKKEKTFAIGGALVSEATKFAIIGGGLKSVGVVKKIGGLVSGLPSKVKLAGGVGLVGLIGFGTTKKGLQSMSEAEARGLGKTTGAIIGFGEPIAQIGGLILGADPSKSPIQLKTIRTPDGDVVMRSFVAKIPFAGHKGVIPILTKAQVKAIPITKTVAGKTVITGYKPVAFKTALGVPKGAIISPTGEFTPSGAVETKLFFKTLKNIPATQRQIIKGGFGLVEYTKGIKTKALKKDVFSVSEGFRKLSPAQQKVASQFLSKESGGRFLVKGKVFGSGASEVQIKGGLGRQVKDIDFKLATKSADKVSKELVKLLNKVGGTKVSTVTGKEGQIVIGRGKSATKVFDIHGLDSIQDQIQAVKDPFGLSERGTIRVGKTNVNLLSQEGINKLASVSSLDPAGKVSAGASKTRIKDVGDFFRIQQSLIKKLSGVKKVKALKILETTKTASLKKFGIEAFEPAQQTFLGIEAPSDISPSIAILPTAPIISASKIRVSPSISKTPSISPSVFASPSISPSASISPSISPSISVSPSISPSISVSPSPSPSISVSPSPSPSISVSPSPSPSVSVSPSPSPSISVSPSPSLSISPPISPQLPFFFLGFPKTAKRKKKKKVRKMKLKKLLDAKTYVPDFTSRALGLTPKIISQKGVTKLVKQVLTGLEIRRPVVVKRRRR